MAGTATTETVRSADGTAIAYERHGDGTPVVLVGGAFNDRGSVRALAHALAPHFAVYGYDRRARGDSTDTSPYAVQREIEDLAAIIAAAGGSAGVFGHSSGAALAVRAAAGGLAISKLAIYEPPYGGGRYDGLNERVTAAVANGDRTEAIRIFLLDGVGVPAEYFPNVQASPDWEGMSAIAHTLPHDLTVMDDGAVPADAARIGIPTLVMDGGNSPAWFREATAQVADAIPGCRRLTVDGEDHGVLQRPAALVPALVEFFT